MANPSSFFKMPYQMTQRAKGVLMSGARTGAGYGTAGGAVLGGLHGAVTSDPNNPNESTLSRIGTHALGGAMLGAGAGGAVGAGRGHMANVARQSRREGFQKALGLAAAGTAAAGLGAAAKNPEFVAAAKNVAGKAKQTAENVAGKVKQTAQDVTGKVKQTAENVQKGFQDRAAAKQTKLTEAETRAYRRAAKVQGQQGARPSGPAINVPPTTDARRAAKVQGQQSVQQGGAPIEAGPAGTSAARDEVLQRRAAKVQGQQAVQPSGPAIAGGGEVPEGIRPTSYSQWADPNSPFFGGIDVPPPAAPAGPGLIQRGRAALQQMQQNRAASRAAEQEAMQFAENPQWKVSSPDFWSGFMGRAFERK